MISATSLYCSNMNSTFVYTREKHLLSIFLAMMLMACIHKIQFAVAIDNRPHLAAPRGTLKIIKAEDGDLIDCVDIYKQPSLNHPLLKDHKIQIKPSSYPTGLKQVNNASRIIHQTWSKNEDCPEGTIPIRRPFKDESDVSFMRDNLTSRGLSGKKNPSQFVQKSAGLFVTHNAQDMFGVSAAVELWNPSVEPADLSASNIGIAFVEGRDINSVGVGWMVCPRKFGDDKSRFFVYFQSEAYPSTCLNMDCPGFVQVNKEVALGAIFAQTSTYNGPQYEIHATIYQDPPTRNWWLHFGEVEFGYWPASLFQHLVGGANLVHWQGDVMEAPTSSHPTTTHMGSGHYPEEGFGRAALMHTIQYIDIYNRAIDPGSKSVGYQDTNDGCYRTSTLYMGKDGSYFYYGGPGHSPNCFASLRMNK